MASSGPMTVFRQVELVRSYFLLPAEVSEQVYDVYPLGSADLPHDSLGLIPYDLGARQGPAFQQALQTAFGHLNPERNQKYHERRADPGGRVLHLPKQKLGHAPSALD